MPRHDAPARALQGTHTSRQIYTDLPALIWAPKPSHRTCLPLTLPLPLRRRSGLYPLPTPFTPGVEGAGTVVAVGPEVTDFAPGDRVVYSARPPTGSYSELVVVPGDRVVRVPEGLSTELAAAALLQVGAILGGSWCRCCSCLLERGRGGVLSGVSAGRRWREGGGSGAGGWCLLGKVGQQLQGLHGPQCQAASLHHWRHSCCGSPPARSVRCNHSSGLHS